MSWDELETRLRQELSKRLDVTLCQIGRQPARNGLHLSLTPAGNFFFSDQERDSRVRLLRKHLPEQAKQIMADAKQICRHYFRLLGYQNVSYGPEIDWHLDAVHGLRSPLIPWFKINFLNFHEVGDHKVTWELNRHQHLVTLAKAWMLTREKGYADEIFAQWYSWQRANPYPLGANWASSLEVAFRSLSWIWVDHLLAGCPSMPTGFRNDLLHGLALNGRHIDRYLSTYFSPNTHLLGEAVALFFLGTLYPQLAEAETWKHKGWRIVQEESVRQVRPDGIYFEQTLYYHVYALDFFLYARLLASRNDMEIPAEYDHVLRKMLGFVEAVSQVGPPEGFGDDDGGRLFDSSRNRAEHMTDPLTLGAALYRDENMRAGKPLTEEAIWLFGERGVTPPPSSLGAACSQAFPEGGIYVVVSSEPDPQQMIIDAGPQGTGHCGHGHADALSVKLSFAGRRWLVDAGTCWYIGPGNERDTFRGTRAHNTLSVDGLDQAQPDGPFAWSSIPKTQVDLQILGPSFTLFAGSHSGYERLSQPVRHGRIVFQADNFWLIRDVAGGLGPHRLETSWHFAADLEVVRSGNTFLAGRRNPGEPGHLMFTPVNDARWSADLLSDQVSPAYGEKVSAPVIRCGAQTELPAEHATILIAASGKDSDCEAGELVRVALPNAEAAPEAIYQYQSGVDTHTMIFRAAQKSAWKFGPWTSDARFLYFHVKNRRVDHLVFCEGSFVQLRGESLISRDSPLQWLEWTNRDGRDRVASSDEAAAKAFAGTALGSEINT